MMDIVNKMYSVTQDKLSFSADKKLEKIAPGGDLEVVDVE